MYKCPCPCKKEAAFQTEMPEGASHQVDSQVGLTCSSSSVGKALVAIIDEMGYDTNQEEIIKKLKGNVSSPVNTSVFNGMNLAVTVIDKKTKKKMSKTIIISVEEKGPKNVKDAMVLRSRVWDFKQEKYEFHAI